MPDIIIPYTPRPLQRQIHNSLKRWSVLVCHRRFGKTVLCVNELIKKALTCTLPRPRYAYLAPLYKQARRIAWDYLRHYTAPIPGAKPNEAGLYVDLPNGARIELLGADNPDSLRGVYLDGVVLDEPAQMSPRVFPEIIRPALADRQGWAVWIGTPKGRNHFCDRYESAVLDEEHYAGLWRASETGIIPEAELQAARRAMSEDEYAQEFECSFSAAIRGAYYGKLLDEADRDGRIRGVPWEPQLPVDTAWDLGVGDATSIWFTQSTGREIRWIDYYEASGVGLDHYAKILQERPYVYGAHLAPFDIEVTEFGSGLKRIDQARTLGIRFQIVQKAPVDDGIAAMRNIIRRSYWDRVKCADGLEALRQYSRDWDEKRQDFKPKPRHDWTSHAADAARYRALGDDMVQWSRNDGRPRQVQAVMYPGDEGPGLYERPRGVWGGPQQEYADR